MVTEAERALVGADTRAWPGPHSASGRVYIDLGASASSSTKGGEDTPSLRLVVKVVNDSLGRRCGVPCWVPLTNSVEPILLISLL